MDLYNLVISAKLSKGEGGDVSVDPLSVTENGTYTASSGHAYSPVTVDVPNSYAASDEGKVVSNGALVGQTSATKTANGTYDTTLNNEVVVNVPSVTPTGNINITSTAQTDVSAYATAQVVDADLVAGNIKKDVDILGVVGTYEGGGGGGSSYTLLHEEDIEVSTTSTGITAVKTINLATSFTGDTLYFKIRDKNPRDMHLFGTDSYIMNPKPVNGSTSNFIKPLTNVYMTYDHKYYQDTGQYGIFPSQIQSNGLITISSRYNSSTTGTIDGTYHLEIYKLKQPDGASSVYITPIP